MTLNIDSCVSFAWQANNTFIIAHPTRLFNTNLKWLCGT